MSNAVTEYLPSEFYLIGENGHKETSISTDLYSDAALDTILRFLDILARTKDKADMLDYESIDVDKQQDAVVVTAEQGRNSVDIDLRNNFNFKQIGMIECFLDDVKKATEGWKFIDAIIFLKKEEVTTWMSTSTQDQ